MANLAAVLTSETGLPGSHFCNSQMEGAAFTYFYLKPERRSAPVMVEESLCITTVRRGGTPGLMAAPAEGLACPAV